MADQSRLLAEQLRQAIRREATPLRELPETLAQTQSAGETSWSPKQELGHLIDSATNNHARFVSAATRPEFHGATYAQNDWVKAHGYQQMPWQTIVEFWIHYNNFIADFIERIPDDKLTTSCFIGSAAPVSLNFLISDYIVHMQHHLDHLLARPYPAPYPSA